MYSTVAYYDTPLLRYRDVVCRIIINYNLICQTVAYYDIPLLRYRELVCRIIIDGSPVCYTIALCSSLRQTV